MIQCFEESVNKTQGELNKRLQEFEGDSPDYRLKRGLAHLLRSGFCTFEIVSPLEPVELRQKVFTLSAKTIPSLDATEQTLEQLATQLSQDLNREVLPHQILSGLYADLQENRILTQLDSPTPEALLHRYNLSQVQGIFYQASQIIINAYRNDQGNINSYFAI